MSDYKIKDLGSKIKKLGIKKNDKIFCHSNISLFGIPDCNLNTDNLCKNFYETIINAIGNKGMLIIPTYTYSFSTNRYGRKFKEKEVFDFSKTPSKMGIFSEWIRKNIKGFRTNDPFYSHFLIGKHAHKYSELQTNNSFDNKSIFAIIEKENFKFLNFNFPGSSFIHYLEKKYKVHYRFDKSFTGEIVINNNLNKISWIINVNYKNLKVNENHIDVIKNMSNKKLIKKEKFGRGEIISFSVNDLKKITFQMLKKDKNSLISKYD